MPTTVQENRYFIDGADLWTYFGVGVESGSDDFLNFAKPKERTANNWGDENGLDIDLSRTYLEAKEVTLNCHIIANDKADFWLKYYRLQGIMIMPGLRRLHITEFNQDFYVYYKEMKTIKRFTRIREGNLVACKFTLTLVEKEPTPNVQTFIIDEEFRMLIV